MALTTTAINSNGSLGNSQTFSWDLTTNSVPSTSIPAPVPGTAGHSAGNNLTYFLAIDGLNGGSRELQHVGWFTVSSYDANALAAAMAGSATFSPLTVTVTETGLTGVLADLANGTVIPSVRLEGIRSSDPLNPNNGQAVYDLTLGNVTVSDYEEAPGGATVSLSYQQVELTTTPPNTSPQTFSWNLATNSADVSIPTPVPGTASNQFTMIGTVSVAPAGLSITSVTPSVVENGQATEIGTATPGLAGDTLTLQQTGGSEHLRCNR